MDFTTDKSQTKLVPLTPSTHSPHSPLDGCIQRTRSVPMMHKNLICPYSLDLQEIGLFKQPCLTYHNGSCHPDINGFFKPVLIGAMACVKLSLTDWNILLLNLWPENNVDSFIGTDCERIAVKNFAAKFKQKNCPSLAGKPKIFLMQFCRRGAVLRFLQFCEALYFLSNTRKTSLLCSLQFDQPLHPLRSLFLQVAEHIGSCQWLLCTRDYKV